MAEYYAFYERLNLHVGDSNMKVIRAIRKKFKPGFRKKRAHRKDRHEVYRAVLKEHKKARAVFHHYRF